MKGKVYHSELTKEKDNITGVEITRLTDDTGDTHHPYFTQSLVSHDGKVLLLSSNRTGSWQLYSLGIDTGKIVQLTDDGKIAHHGAVLDPKKMIAYYFNGGALKSVDLSNLKTSELFYSVPEGFKSSSLSLSGKGRYLVFSYSQELNLSTTIKKIYSDFVECFYRRPHSVIMRIDLEKERAETIWGEVEWFSHTNISPVDDNIILFCHEGPWHLLQRMWVVNALSHEVRPLLPQRQYLESSGHEFFTKSGKVATQYGIRGNPLSSDWTYYDVIINPDGSNLERYRYRYIGKRPTHIQINSKENLGVGDRAFPDDDPGFKEGNDYVGLIEYKNQQAKVSLLCRHNTSWRTQHSHPHPIFTPDNKNIIFSSDRGGRCNVYMAPVPERG